MQSIATAENILSIQRFLEDGKRVRVLAPRRSGKTELALALECDYHVVTTPLQQQLVQGRVADLRAVVTTFDAVIDNPDAVIVLDEFLWLPRSIKQYFQSPRPILCIGTPLECGGHMWDDVPFDVTVDL